MMRAMADRDRHALEYAPAPPAADPREGWTVTGILLFCALMLGVVGFFAVMVLGWLGRLHT